MSLDLDPASHHHRHDPATSRHAAQTAMATATPALLAVMSCHQFHHYTGVTDDELVQLLPDLDHTARARASDLRKAGLLEPTGETRPTRKNRPAVVWHPSPAGDRWSREFAVPDWHGSDIRDLARGSDESPTATRLAGECPLCGQQFIGRPGLCRHLRATHKAVA